MPNAPPNLILNSHSISTFILNTHSQLIPNPHLIDNYYFPRISNTYSQLISDFLSLLIPKSPLIPNSQSLLIPNSLYP